MKKYDGIVIAINECNTPFCYDQVHKLSEGLDYAYYVSDSTETPEHIEALVEAAYNAGMKHIVYLTEESQVTDIQLGLNEDYGKYFESIEVLPENYYRVGLESLNEVDAQPVAKPQVIPTQVQNKNTQRPVNKNIQRQKPNIPSAFLFIIPTNLPIKGTKAIIDSAIAKMKGQKFDYMVPVPSAGGTVNPKTQITNLTTAQAVWSLCQSAKRQKIGDDTIYASSWYSCIVPKDKAFNGAIYYKLINYQQKNPSLPKYTIVSSKDVCAAAATYGFSVLPICDAIPNDAENQKMFAAVIQLFDKYTKLFKDQGSLDKYAQDKKLGQCPENWLPPADDVAILKVIEEIYAISQGKKDPTKALIGDDSGLSSKGLEDFMKALSELIPERDKELAKEWTKDTIVGEYIMDGAKAIKNAYNHVKNDSKPDKTYTHKQKQDDANKKIEWSNKQIQYLLMNSDDFQNIKNGFDKGFYLKD